MAALQRLDQGLNQLFYPCSPRWVSVRPSFQPSPDGLRFQQPKPGQALLRGQVPRLFRRPTEQFGILLAYLSESERKLSVLVAEQRRSSHPLATAGRRAFASIRKSCLCECVSFIPALGRARRRGRVSSLPFNSPTEQRENLAERGGSPAVHARSDFFYERRNSGGRTVRRAPGARRKAGPPRPQSYGPLTSADLHRVPSNGERKI